MQDRWVSGFFNDYDQAKEALLALTKSFDPKDISIFAEDPGELRSVELCGGRARADSVIMWFGLAGALIGMLAGAMIRPPSSETIIVLPILAAFMGAAAGWCLGLVFGTIVHFDVPPLFNAINEATVSHGKAVIVVHCKDREERYRAEAILDELGVSDIISRSEKFVATR